MITAPNCKINLGLHVVERRPDGYHNLQTLFVPVPLCDELEIVPSEQFSFQQEGILVEGDPEENLCVRAYRLMQRHCPQVGPVAMRLKKRIPFGAGLGGGSSDAAFVLVMLRQLFHLDLSDRQLETLAVQLGADCPFFVRNKPAYATGIGDILEPVELDLGSYRLVLLKPDDAVSTREAYGGIRPNAQNRPDLRQVIRRPIGEWRQQIVNDFETTVFPHHPRIAFLKVFLYKQGALYASMSGSGSTVFGLFDSQNEIDLSAIPSDEILYVG
ncbi:MAG: 4-(cytidine 5'-diphospho)-2-C-methyl-D-erythritol kinase [Bacteroidales bacterium]|nr:4-(cytidine 5'-diphospho)-2-C-methyl-D-erythritol kinase [Bacteroidales bacterium]